VSDEFSVPGSTEIKTEIHDLSMTSSDHQLQEVTDLVHSLDEMDRKQLS